VLHDGPKSVNEPQAPQSVTQGEQPPAPGSPYYIDPSTELANASRLWALLEAIAVVLKMTPDHELRIVANEIIARIEAAVAASGKPSNFRGIG